MRSLSMVVLSVLLALPVTARELVVAPEGAPYATIGAAVAAAQPGDTVRVRRGVYRETVQPRVERLVLVGEGAIIDGGGSDGIWPANGGVVRGFVIQHCDDAIFVTSDTRDVVIEQNVLAFNSGQAIVLMDGLANVSIRNNILWRNGDGIYNQGHNTVDAHHNLVFENESNDYYLIASGAGDLAQDPRFEDPARGDYRLRSDSPARRAGSDGVDLGAVAGEAGFAPFVPEPAAPSGAEAPAAVATPAVGPAEALPSFGPRIAVEVLFVDGDGDGLLEAGEEGVLTVTLHNRGVRPTGAVALRASLVRPPKGLTLSETDATLGVIAAGRDASASFPVRAAKGTASGKPASVRLVPTLEGMALPQLVVDVPLGR